MPKIDKQLGIALAVAAGVMSVGSYMIGKSVGLQNGLQMDFSMRESDTPQFINIYFPHSGGKKRVRSVDVRNIGAVGKVKHNEANNSIDVIVTNKEAETVGSLEPAATAKESTALADQAKESTDQAKDDVEKVIDKVSDSQFGKILLPNIHVPVEDKTVKEVIDPIHLIAPNTDQHWSEKELMFRIIEGLAKDNMPESVTSSSIRSSIKSRCNSPQGWLSEKANPLNTANYIFWCTTYKPTNEMMGRHINSQHHRLRA